jgi:hypothetical protein
MTSQSHVELTRLHCERLRRLIDFVISELAMIERTLSSNGNFASASVATQLQAVATQSEHIATETLRLQKFVQALRLESTAASEAALES